MQAFTEGLHYTGSVCPCVHGFKASATYRVGMISISPSRLGVFLVAAVLVVRVAGAQIVQAPTPSPSVTAADAAWRLRGDPVFYSGAFYDPSGATKFFDGNVMVQSGTFEGVPLYVDPTSTTTYTTVLVPIGGNLMRPYVRRPDGSPARGATPEAERPKDDTVDATSVAPPSSRPVVSSPRPAVASIPRSTSNRGIWISYEGRRWRSAGAAVSYSADRFELVGQYRGLPVYRDTHGPANEIYIPSVKDGPLAPFRKN